MSSQPRRVDSPTYTSVSISLAAPRVSDLILSPLIPYTSSGLPPTSHVSAPVLPSIAPGLSFSRKSLTCPSTLAPQTQPRPVTFNSSPLSVEKTLPWLPRHFMTGFQAALQPQALLLSMQPSRVRLFSVSETHCILSDLIFLFIIFLCP